MSEIAGVLFDLDGTLVQSERHWPRIDEAFFSSLLGATNWEAWKPVWRARRDAGVLLDHIFQECIETHGLSTQVSEIKASREEAMCAYYALHLKPTQEDVSDVLEQLLARGYRMAIVSGMSPNLIRRTSEIMGWRAWFHAFVSTHEAGASKPDSAVYHLALHRVAFDPSICLAVENEWKGYASANGAGIQCRIVPDTEARRREGFDRGIPEECFANTLREACSALLYP